VRSFIPEGPSFLGEDTALESGVAPLFVKFLERGDNKCRDREVFG